MKKIIERLLNIARITEAGKFRNRSEDYHLKDKLSNAEKLLSRIKEFIKILRQNKFDELELELVRKKRKYEEESERLKLLRIASKKEKFISGNDLIDNLKNFVNKLKEYEYFNDNDVKKWEYLNKELENNRILIEKKEREFVKLKSDLEKFLSEKHKLDKSISENEVKVEIVKRFEKVLDKKEELEREYHLCFKELENINEKLMSDKNKKKRT